MSLFYGPSAQPPTRPAALTGYVRIGSGPAKKQGELKNSAVLTRIDHLRLRGLTAQTAVPHPESINPFRGAKFCHAAQRSAIARNGPTAASPRWYPRFSLR